MNRKSSDKKFAHICRILNDIDDFADKGQIHDCQEDKYIYANSLNGDERHYALSWIKEQ